MTFWAERDKNVKHNVNVQVTSGPVTIKVTEHYQYLRVFWGDLGRILSEAEKDAES